MTNDLTKIPSENIQKILDPNETILWSQKPLFWSYMFDCILPILPFAVMWNSFIWFMIISAFQSEGYNVLMIPHVWIGFALLLYPIYVFLNYRNTFYYVTNRRAIIQSGVIGIDFTSIDFSQIISSEVSVGLIDKIVRSGSGSVNLTLNIIESVNKNTVNKKASFLGVEKVYEFYGWLKNLSYSVHTDVQYPNAYRPNINPGYNTKLVGEQFKNNFSSNNQLFNSSLKNNYLFDKLSRKRLILK